MVNLTIPSLEKSHWTKDEAFAYCRRLAKAHYENFTVGSLFIPPSLRQHMYNVYAYCRISDDLGDETGDPKKALELLNQWEKELYRCYQGSASHPVFVALSSTIQQFDLPKEPFWRLIQAFKQDQVKTRYQNFDEVVGYCVNSANPVGHLVLYLFGYRDKERQALSDYTCTALQLANFWQDIKRDLAIGRIYLPLDEMNRFNVKESDLSLPRAKPELKKLLAFQVERTRELFTKGSELVRQVEGWLKLDLGAFSEGGLAVLEGIEKIDYDVLATRPQVSRWAKGKILLNGLKGFLFNSR